MFKIKKQSVVYIDHMGKDLSAVNSARVSYGVTKDTLEPKDEKLLDYLAKNKHYSPFEHTALTVKIECPLYIRSQIVRHRSFSYNEISRRYTSEDLSFYLPEAFRKQHEKSKQCSDGAADAKAEAVARVAHEKLLEESLKAYNDMLDAGVSRELARGILPQCLMTSFYMTGNLRSWNQFLELRLHEHAQQEAREIGEMVEEIILDKFPKAYEALQRHRK